MRRLIVTALLAAAAAACTPPAPHGDEGGPDFGPDPGSDEWQRACPHNPHQPVCRQVVK